MTEFNLVSKIKTNDLIKRRYLVYLLSVLTFLMFLYPSVIEITPYFKWTRRIQSMLSMLSLLLYVLFDRKDKIINLIILFFSLTLISTVINKGSISAFIFHFTSTFGLIYLSRFLYKNNRREFFYGVEDFSFLILSFHAISIFYAKFGLVQIVTPNNVDKFIYIFGEANQSVIYVVSYLSVVLLNHYFFNDRTDKIIPILATFFALISIHYSDAETAYMGIMAFITALILGYIFIRKDVFKYESGKKHKYAIFFIGVIVLANIFIVLVRLQNLIPKLLDKFFSNDPTFSGRTIIWDEALRMAGEKPLLGYGFITGRYIVFSTGSYRFFDAHNLLLQMSLFGGLLTVAVYLYIMYVTFKEVLKSKNNYIKLLSVASLLGIAVMCVAENYSLRIIFWTITIIYTYGQQTDSNHKFKNYRSIKRRIEKEFNS